MRYTENTNPDRPQAMGTFHPEPSDTIPGLMQEITGIRELHAARTGNAFAASLGLAVYAHKVPRPGKRYTVTGRVRPGDGMPRHAKSVADAIALCETAGLEFWSLAPRRALGFSAGVAWAVRDSRYFLVTADGDAY